MFNDLNQNNQSVAQKQPVDDIFAETDKSAEAKNFSGYYNQNPPTLSAVSSDIETQKVGLSAGDNSVPAKGKILKVALIALLIILLIGLGYLIYIKFLTGQTVVENQVVNNNVVVTSETATKTPEFVPTQTTPVSEELTVVTSTPIGLVTPPVSDLTDTDNDGLTDEEETVLGTNINLTDTDNDGLNDFDEVKLNNTNANQVDTDGDGLSDYEEIKIYKTDPTTVDSDNDGYQDKSEIDSGYNPLGDGKLSDVKN